MNDLIWLYSREWETFNTGNVLYVINLDDKLLKEVYPWNSIINLTQMWESKYLFEYKKKRYTISFENYDVKIESLATIMWTKNED